MAKGRALIIGILCAAIIVVCASTSVHAGNSDQDGCEKGGMDGLMKVSSQILNDQFKELAGGSDYGMKWVCSSAANRNARKGTLYFAKKVKAKVKAKATSSSPAVYYYTMYPDIELSSGNETDIMMIGQVHSNSILTMENYAIKIGVCAKATVEQESSCAAGSKATVTFKDGTTKSIFKSLPSNVHRQTNTGTGKMRAIQGYWARPYVCGNAWIPNSFNVGDEFQCTTTNATINNKVLKKAIDEDTDDGSSSDIIDKTVVTVGNKKMTKVKLYLHHQWSGTADGSAYTGTANVSTIYLLVDYQPNTGWTDTFKAKVDAVAKDLTKTDGVYYTDSDKATVQFTHSIQRESTNSGAAINEAYQIWYAKGSGSVSSATSPTPDESTTVSLSDTQWHVVKDKREQTFNLSAGTNVFCDTIGWNKSVNNKNETAWDHKDGCVTIYRTMWYDMSGQVLASSDADKDDSGIYWTDKNTANIKFTHQVSTTSSVAIKPKYKTRKDPNPGEAFPDVASYTIGSTAIDKNTGWHTVLESPSSAGTVNIDAGDTGNTFKQYLDYYSKVREDSGDFSTAKTATGQITIKRYKTTFTGSIEIHVNSDKVTDDEGNKISNDANIAGKTIHVSDDEYPSGIPITFEHIVTRSNSDAHGSPSGKSVAISTEVTKHDGVRSSDDYGTAMTDTIGPLTKGNKDSKTDTFTVQVYPEHNIVLCQKLTYTSEIQGEEATASATTNDACVTIVMEHADCLGNKTFGIKNGKNWLKAEIYKNSSSAATKATEALYEGSTNSIVEWAKPGDQIRYKYYGCAGGELARQYQNADAHTTTYSISTDKAGYLFGRKVGKDAAGTYNALSTTIGSSSSTDGTGPFDKSFTITVGSPSGDGETEAEMLYSCGAHGNNAIKNFYRIPNYIAGVSAADYRDKCSSDDSGRVDDLGSTITQFASWTDIQYSGGSVYNGHDGSATTKITAQVKVPYNYRTGIKNSGTGGDIFPGTKHTEHIMLDVMQRTNSLVNGTSEYATATKPSNYRLIQIKIGPEYDGGSTDFNNTINANGVDDTYGGTYFDDDDGSKNLAAELPICQSFNCEIKVSGNNTQFGDKYNGSSERSIGSYTLEVPYDTKPGTKFCYISAIWPSDSHNDQDLEDIDATANEIALKTGKIEGSKWHLSGASCFTTAKRPSISVLGGDTYAQRYITGKAIKYPQGENGANPRIYSSWAEYGLIAGDSIQGFASGASLWGGSNNVSNKPNANVNCIFSALTYANSGCKDGNLGSLGIDTNASSSPKNLTDQIRTRYTRDNGEAYSISRSGDTIAIGNSGTCVYNGSKFVKDPEDGSFDCIGDTGAKYTHIATKTSQTASIQSTFCLNKGNENDNHASVIHADGTLVIGANVIYGTGSNCTPESYTSLNEIPQYIFVANRIVIKQDVTHIDGWLVANEIITCDPSGEDDWAGTVAQSEINSKNCNQQLTINGPVMAKSLKLYRTFGGGYDDSANLASPAEIFKLGPESYMWAYNQASRYSQATTTYSRELAPRY